MKKLLPILLAFCLLFSAAASAGSAPALVKTFDGCNDVILSYGGKVLGVQSDTGDGYFITDLYGNALLDGEFTTVTQKRGGTLLVSQPSEDVLNGTGLVSPDGVLLVPCAYAGIELVSADGRWTLADHGVASDKSNYEFYVRTADGTVPVLVDRVDVYFNGQQIGSFERSRCRSAIAYGDYLMIKDEAGNYHAYNSRLELSPLDDVMTRSEYVERRENGSSVMLHNPSGQQVCTPECTLTADEVGESLIKGYHVYYDLQGNTVFEIADDIKSVGDFNEGADGRYAHAKGDSGYGLIRDDGFVAVPCIYDEVRDSAAFRDYLAVSKDGKLGYADLNGELVYLSDHDYSSCKISNTFSTVPAADGSLIVITPMGELEQHFKDVRMPDGHYGGLLAVETASGEIGVIDMTGAAVLPFNEDYYSLYGVNISYDGSAIAAITSSGWEVYSVDGGTPEPQPEESASDNGSAAPESLPEGSETDDGGWVCETCGKTCTGNFCPEDGTAKPEAPTDDGSWVCEVCGATNTGNFCPNDGTKRPEEPAGWVCPACGATVETNFCTNDGTKKPE